VPLNHHWTIDLGFYYSFLLEDLQKCLRFRIDSRTREQRPWSTLTVAMKNIKSARAQYHRTILPYGTRKGCVISRCTASEKLTQVPPTPVFSCRVPETDLNFLVEVYVPFYKDLDCMCSGNEMFFCRRLFAVNSIEQSLVYDYKYELFQVI
jgi:hypothetical protein